MDGTDVPSLKAEPVDPTKGVGVGGEPEKGVVGRTANSKSPRSTATKVRTRGGVRTMKMYSLTEGELGELSALRWGATIAFSTATACLGFWISVTQAIDFSEQLSPVVRATWETWKLASLIASIISSVIGVGLIWRGHTRLDTIKAEMEHD
jgi:hypothetical protein